MQTLPRAGQPIFLRGERVRFAWTATGTVTEDLDEVEHTFIVVTAIESEDYAKAEAMRGLLTYSKGDRVTLELTELVRMGAIRTGG